MGRGFRGWGLGWFGGKWGSMGGWMTGWWSLLWVGGLWVVIMPCKFGFSLGKIQCKIRCLGTPLNRRILSLFYPA
jgi:hypothetical protein